MTTLTLPFSLRRLAAGLAVWMLTLGLAFAPAAAQDAGSDGAQPAALQQTLDAHGGLDAFRGYGTLEYDFERSTESSTIQDRQTIDLSSRSVYIESEGYTLGYDGEVTWITPNAEALSYPASPGFYSSTYFYFFAVPFVFADPGVNAESDGQATVDGTTYDVVRISFDSGTGHAPDDRYVLYVDPETRRTKMLRYSVTYGDMADDRAPNSVLVYRAFQDAGGLTVPRRGTFHAWNGGDLGPEKASVTYTNVSFSPSRPDASLFEAPENAEIEEMPGGE
jgi:hypothetical protein